MSSHLALIGGEEFADGFEDVHASLLELARQSRNNGNQRPVQVAFLPTCASEDGPEVVEYWCELAKSRLEALGAEVDSLRIVDQKSANDPQNAECIARADWIYFGGGYPHVGLRILGGSRVLQALETARQRGALIAGASAGAMMMCSTAWVITPEMDAAINAYFSGWTSEFNWDISLPPLLDGLGLLPHSMCWPHANQFFSLAWLKAGLLPPGHLLIGIDEQTALVTSGQNRWQVLGRGKVTLVNDRIEVQEFPSSAQLNF